MIPRKYDIWTAALKEELEPWIQGRTRPVIVVQNDHGNEHSNTVIIVPLTTVIKREDLPTHFTIKADQYGNQLRNSQVLCEQVMTIGKELLGSYIHTLHRFDQEKLDQALRVSLAL